MGVPSQKVLAKALGVNPSIVTRDKAKGMPTHSIEEAIAWRRANVRPRLNPTPAPDGTRRPVPDRHLPDRVAVDDDDAPADTYWSSRARRETAEAELAELKLAEQRNELVRTAVVRASVSKRAAALRESFLQLPARVVPLLAADPTPASMDRILRAEIVAALAQLTEGE